MCCAVWGIGRVSIPACNRVRKILVSAFSHFERVVRFGSHLVARILECSSGAQHSGVFVFIMTRHRLDELSLKELQEEARSYGLKNVSEDRRKCIDAIMSHLEKNGPWSDRNILQEAPGEPSLPSSSASNFAGAASSHTSLMSAATSTRNQGAQAEAFLPQFCAMMTQQMQLQRE